MFLKCNDRWCGTCPIIQDGPSIIIQLIRQYCVIKDESTCITDNVLYMLTCSGCEEQYVGEICMMLRRGITFQRQHINTPQYRILEVSRHIVECRKGNFSVTPF